MNNNIFRQKSIERISSPEDLNKYVRVTNPPIWIVLTGIILILAGACIWGVFGRLDTNINSAVIARDGTITAYISEADVDRVSAGMDIAVNGVSCSIGSVTGIPVKADDVSEYALYKGNLENEKWLFYADVKGDLPDGIYKGNITVERIAPISFVIN